MLRGGSSRPPAACNPIPDRPKFKTTKRNSKRPRSKTFMRHKVAGYKLKRNVAARKALFRGLITSVIEHERIITTVPKAKAVKPLVEKMITLAKHDTLHSRRQAAMIIETPATL